VLPFLNKLSAISGGECQEASSPRVHNSWHTLITLMYFVCPDSSQRVLFAVFTSRHTRITRPPPCVYRQQSACTVCCVYIMILPTDIAANELLLINSRSPSAETGSFIRLFPLLLVFSSRKCRNCAPVCERGRQIEKEREIERERERVRALE
jgi:hypothetical protein